MSSKRKKNKKNSSPPIKKSASEVSSSQKEPEKHNETEIEVTSPVPVVDEDKHVKYRIVVGDSNISLYVPLGYDMSK